MKHNIEKFIIKIMHAAIYLAIPYAFNLISLKTTGLATGAFVMVFLFILSDFFIKPSITKDGKLIATLIYIIYMLSYAIGTVFDSMVICFPVVIMYMTGSLLFCSDYVKENKTTSILIAIIICTILSYSNIGEVIRSQAYKARVAKFVQGSIIPRGLILYGSDVDVTTFEKIGFTPSEDMSKSPAAHVLHKGAYFDSGLSNKIYYSWCKYQADNRLLVKHLQNGDLLVFCGTRGNLTIPAKYNYLKNRFVK